MESGLENKKVAILVADDFEQGELTEPKTALEAAGATTDIISPAGPVVKGRQLGEPGNEFPVEVPLKEANPGNYHGLLLPGGVPSVSNLRLDEEAVQFVEAFFEADKPVAAICHAPWLLIEAGLLEGRRLTSAESIQTDIRNAGGEWVDDRVVVDRQLVTCGEPGDLLLLNQTFIEKLALQEKVRQ